MFSVYECRVCCVGVLALWGALALPGPNNGGGALVQFPGMQPASPDRAGIYRIPVSIQGVIPGAKTENRGGS